MPLKFSLGGDQGLDVLAEGYPVSKQIDCSTSAEIHGVQETMTAEASRLRYDAGADQYVYVWKTDRSWAGTCRQLEVKLTDGTSHRGPSGSRPDTARCIAGRPAMRDRQPSRGYSGGKSVPLAGCFRSPAPNFRWQQGVVLVAAQV